MPKKISHDSETLAVGEQVFTACAFIHHDFDGVTKLFLPKRADTKKFLPGIYELPGGHIDFGEDIVAGLKREIKEELGINIAVGDPFAVFDYHNELKVAHAVEIIYFARCLDPIEQITIDPEDHSTSGWFAEDELEQVISDQKPQDDPEIQAMYKGFSLLKGNQPNFG